MTLNVEVVFFYPRISLSIVVDSTELLSDFIFVCVCGRDEAPAAHLLDGPARRSEQAQRGQRDGAARGVPAGADGAAVGPGPALGLRSALPAVEGRTGAQSRHLRTRRPQGPRHRPSSSLFCLPHRSGAS